MAAPPDEPPGTGPGEAGGLIACPTCDALYHMREVPIGQRASCQRCGTVLLAPKNLALTRIVMLAATAVILMIAAIFFPFLELKAGGLARQASVMEAVLAFSKGAMLPLSIAVGALIVVLPILRLCAILYALAPLVFGWAPAPHAARVFRWADSIRPWAMAEIFILGVAVALVKVAGMATIALGPAFWAFVALVIVTVLKDNFMSRLIVWKTLDERARS